MKVGELKELLGSHDIYNKGTKPELLERAFKANFCIDGNAECLEAPGTGSPVSPNTLEAGLLELKEKLLAEKIPETDIDVELRSVRQQYQEGELEIGKNIAPLLELLEQRIRTVYFTTRLRDIPEDTKMDILLKNMYATEPFYMQMQKAVASKNRQKINELGTKSLDVKITMYTTARGQPFVTSKPEDIATFMEQHVPIGYTNNWSIVIENEWLFVYIQWTNIYIRFKPAQTQVVWNLRLKYEMSGRSNRDITITYVNLVYLGKDAYTRMQDLLLGLWWVKKWVFPNIKFSKLIDGDLFKVQYTKLMKEGEYDFRRTDEDMNDEYIADAHGKEMFKLMKKMVKN